ncbi:MAG: hypothetical protein ACOX5W_11980 [Bacillota bacterium]|jgi:hypothetical protein
MQKLKQRYQQFNGSTRFVISIIVLVTGGVEGRDLERINLIHRIVFTAEDTLYSISFIPDGLEPIGIDRLESHHSIRLKSEESDRF